MDVAARYLGEGSPLARRDPRVLILATFAYSLSVIQLADWRSVLVMTVLAFAWYAQARIPWAAARGNWAFAVTVVSVLVLVNAVISGGDQLGVGIPGDQVLASVPMLGTPVTTGSLSYAATLLVRFLGIIAVGFPVAFCVAPGDLGVAVHRLGVPARFAVGVDLTMRFIPLLASEAQTTVDAQRLRGFDPLRAGRGPVSRLRGLAPVVVPTVVGAFASAEDTVDAMELRAFGTGKRTWLRVLRFDSVDRLYLTGMVVMVAVCLTMRITGTWVDVRLLPGLGG
jgi:energy-coupling factor transport system permease protein